MIKQSFRTQKGLSLIELMIAVTLSVVIAAAMISLFVNSKENYRVNENMSRLQESARFAVSFLARDIRMADYRSCVTVDRLINAVAGENGTGLNSSDAVTLIWQTNDCDAAFATETRVYTIQAGAAGVPALFRSINGAAAVELVEGIQSLQILYGEDTDDDDVANYYVDSASISDMAQAISLKITLVVRSLESNLTSSGDAITRNFTSTITLRNRLP